MARATTGCLDRASVSFDDPPADREAEPEAALLPAGFDMVLEGAEDTLEPRWLDADAGILDHDAESPLVGIIHRDGDATALGRELQRVSEEVRDDLLQP